MERLVFLKPVLILVAGSSKGLFALALCSFGTSCVYAASTGIARRTGALGISQLAVSPPLTLEWLLGTHALMPRGLSWRDLFVHDADKAPSDQNDHSDHRQDLSKA